MKKRFLSLLLVLPLVLTLFLAASADSGFVYDEADLLTYEEEGWLSDKLAGLSQTHNAQIVVVTIPYVPEGTVDSYVDVVYDSRGFGYGENRDGVLLLVCMDSREYRILSNGYPGDAISVRVIDTIGEAIVSDLSDGNYAQAFGTFGEECAWYLNGYVNGFPFNAPKKLGIAAVVGLVIGLITVLILKGQLRSVRSQDRANAYIKPGSMRLTVQRDLYLYRNVTRTKRENSSSGSGGGGGGSRSKGGGSF